MSTQMTLVIMLWWVITSNLDLCVTITKLKKNKLQILDSNKHGTISHFILAKIMIWTDVFQCFCKMTQINIRKVFKNEKQAYTIYTQITSILSSFISMFAHIFFSHRRSYVPSFLFHKDWVAIFKECNYLIVSNVVWW